MGRWILKPLLSDILKESCRNIGHRGLGYALLCVFVCVYVVFVLTCVCVDAHVLLQVSARCACACTLLVHVSIPSLIPPIPNKRPGDRGQNVTRGEESNRNKTSQPWLLKSLLFPEVPAACSIVVPMLQCNIKMGHSFHCYYLLQTSKHTFPACHRSS